MKKNDIDWVAVLERVQITFYIFVICTQIAIITYLFGFSGKWF